MRTLVSTFVTSALICLIGGERPAAADPVDEADAGRGVVVWIVSPSEDVKKLRAAAAPQIEELRLALAIEQSGAPPTVYQALETLAVHRALAVVWHDADGGLQLLFTGEGAPERLTAAAGSPQEEALYVREVLRARLEEAGELVFDLLVTAPGEDLETLSPVLSTGPAAPSVDTVIRSSSPRPRSGGRLGLGYGVRAHFDVVSWSQHTLTVHVPAWRFERFAIVRLMLSVGLPSTIGRTAGDWLEIRSVGGVLGAGWIPMARRWFELELGGGVGFEDTTANAFLSTGKAEGADHLSGQLVVWAALVWHPTPGMDIRLHLNGAYILRPPSYSINGKGDFGAYPWQPGAGVDIAAAMF
jgi:hypothetical protein